MRKTRTNKELLSLLHSKLNPIKYRCGLCTAIEILKDDGKITLKEKKRVESYLSRHRPKNWKQFSPWFFSGGDKRKEWLNLHILRLTK